MAVGQKEKKVKTSATEFIVVARAEDEELAMQYYKVLRYYRVPAQITSSGCPDKLYDTIISVTEEYYEKAFRLITERMPGENFIDMLFRPIEEFELDEQENPNQAA